MNMNLNSSSKEENYIIELFKTILPYKWIILAVSILFMVFAKVYLYFIPLTYESYAIVKVKLNSHNEKNRDIVNKGLLHSNSVGIKQEMVILQTYKMNKKVLEKINFKVQFFKELNYKKIEQYSDISIKMEEIIFNNPQILGKYLKISPLENGFTVMLDREDNGEIYVYDELVETPFFIAKVTKNENFSSPIYIKLNGNNRYIYENIIKRSLLINQIDLGVNLIRIAFQDTIPERANNYINTLIDIYIEESIRKKNTNNNKVLDFLDEKLALTKQKLQVAEGELESYQSKNENIDPEAKTTDVFRKLSDIDLELSELGLKEQLINNLIIFIKHNNNLDAIAPSLIEFGDKTTIKLIDILQKLKLDEDQLTVEFTDSYPKLRQLRKRMKRIRKKIVLNIKNLKAILLLKRKNLIRQKEKYEKQLKSLPRKEKKLISFKRKYEVNSKIYTYLLEKKSENELLNVTNVADYEIVDSAYTPSNPIKPKASMMLIIAGLVGLIFSVLFALIRSLTVDKIKKTKDILALTQLPLYGNIPFYKNGMFQNIEIEEAYRKLAINLQFTKRENEGHIILISSTVEGEGKTTTVAALSAIFNNTGEKAIVVDMDLYNPSLHTHFGLDAQYSGLSTFLSQRDNLGNIIFTTRYAHLDIIPAGPIPPNPSELILSRGLGALLETLKQRYDYIFIDTASFETAPETFYLMRYSDLNLVVFRQNFSKKFYLMELERKINEKHLNNVGLIVKSEPIRKKRENLSKQIIMEKPLLLDSTV